MQFPRDEAFARFGSSFRLYGRSCCTVWKISGIPEPIIGRIIRHVIRREARPRRWARALPRRTRREFHVTGRGSSLAEAGSRRNRHAGFISFHSPGRSDPARQILRRCAGPDQKEWTTWRLSSRRRGDCPGLAGRRAGIAAGSSLRATPSESNAGQEIRSAECEDAQDGSVAIRKGVSWWVRRSSAPCGGVVVVPEADSGPARRRVGHRDMPGGALPGSRNAAAARPGNLSPQAPTRSTRSDASSGVRPRRSCRARAIVRTPPSTAAIPRRSWRTSWCRGNGPGR